MKYLASPYSSVDPAVQEQRFQDACRIVAYFLRQGEVVFSPICHFAPVARAGDLPHSWEFWQAQDEWFIRHADEVRVLMLPGWEQSIGIAAEVELARLFGKRVTYWKWENGEAVEATP